MGGISSQFKHPLIIAKKNIKIYYLKGPAIIFGLLFPSFLPLAYVIGRNMPLKEILPGLMNMTVFFSSTSVGPYIIPWEIRSKTP